jgi:transglutaminase-like putative cysteine protease
MVVTAARGPCQGLVGTAPVPIDWPEQEVRIVEEDFSPTARVSYRMVEGTVKQMVVEIPFLPAGQECRAVVTVEIKRSSQLPPDDPSVYVLPDKRRVPREVRPYLGPSPGIECTGSRMRNMARQLRIEEGTAWDQVEALYDWVRDNIEYKQGRRGGALAALRDEVGDHEDLTSLFIALCRASNVPARTVWVPNHCYAEFYLEDAERKGRWFPCQVAGNRAFGEMPDHSPILQKGDSFTSPTDRKKKRYLPESLTGAGGSPSVKWVRQLVTP